ncbi:MAG: hypothetical protein ACK4ZN_08840 [Oceanibaculum sp.]
MRAVTVICRYVANEADAVLSDVAIEMALAVPAHYADGQVAAAAIEAADRRVVGIAREFGSTYRRVTQAEGIFCEVRHG